MTTELASCSAPVAPAPVAPSSPGMRVDRPDLPLAPAPFGSRGEDPVHPAVDAFRVLNRWLMIPVTRAGRGAWLSTPLGGSMVLLRIRGRRSGQVRETPLNYVVAEGALWVLAGFGPRTEWYRNLQADPTVEAVLPGRTIRGRATDIRAPETRRRIMPAIVRSTMGPSLAAGINPFGTPDAILGTMGYVPLLRIDPDAGWLEPGPDDPGGLAWVWRQGLVVGAGVVGLLVVRRALGTLRHPSG